MASADGYFYIYNIPDQVKSQKNFVIEIELKFVSNFVRGGVSGYTSNAVAGRGLCHGEAT